MEEEKKLNLNYLYLVIPVLAVLVIGGAIFISSSLKSMKLGPVQEAVVKKPVVLSFAPPSVNLKQGGTVKVDFYASFEKETAVDGIDLILAFNPQLVEVTQTAPSKLFSYVANRKNELGKGKVSLTFFEEKKGGVLLKGRNLLLSLTLKGKESGRGEIAIVEAEKGATTVVTAAGTSQKIQFGGQNLQIAVE